MLQLNHVLNALRQLFRRADYRHGLAGNGVQLCKNLLGRQPALVLERLEKFGLNGVHLRGIRCRKLAATRKGRRVFTGHRALHHHLRGGGGHAIGAKQTSGTLARGIQPRHSGGAVRINADTALKIMGRGLDNQRAIRLEDFHNIRVDTGFQRRQILVQLLQNFLGMQIQRIIQPSLPGAAARLYLGVQGIGQQHLVPFAVQRQPLHAFGQIAIREGFAILVHHPAIAGGEQDIGQDISLIHGRPGDHRGAEGNHLHIHRFGPGAHGGGLSLSAQIGRTAIFVKNIVRAACSQHHRAGLYRKELAGV